MGSVTPEAVQNAFQALRAPVPEGQSTDNQGASGTAGTTGASATLPATTMAQPAEPRIMPFLFGTLTSASLSTPESISNSIQARDETARGSAAPVSVPVPTPAPVAASAQPMARAPASTVRQGGGMSACGNGGLSDMLSPSCLAVLSSLSPGNVTAAPLPPSPSVSQAQPSFTCTVSLFTAGGNVPTTSTFPAPDLQSCIVAGTKLSHGIIGMSNIVAITPQWGVMGVTCMRDARGIKCEPQP